MIEPFHEKQVRDGVISYGLSSYGYDARIADEFKIFTNINHTIVDPKDFDPRSFVDFQGKECIIPPNSFALARTVEYFRIPRNVIVVLPRQVDLRALRDHRQRHPARARVGGHRHARGLEHDAAARADLRRRGHRAVPVLRGRRGVRDLLRRQEGEVPGAAGPHAAARSSEMSPEAAMVHETVTLEGHLIDSDILRKVFDRVVEEGGEFEVQEFRVGRTNDEPSFARIEVRARDPEALDRILEALRYLGATRQVADAASRPPSRTGSCPTTSTRPRTSTRSCASTGRWVEAADQKMDSALVLRDGVPALREAAPGAPGRAGGAARPRHPRAAARAQPRLLRLRLHVERRLGRGQQGDRDPGRGARDEAGARGGREDRGGGGSGHRPLGRRARARPPGARRLGGRDPHRQRLRGPRPREGDPQDQPRRVPDERPRRRGRQPQPPLRDQRGQPPGRRAPGGRGGPREVRRDVRGGQARRCRSCWRGRSATTGRSRT